jgi:hypothetical protein
VVVGDATGIGVTVGADDVDGGVVAVVEVVAAEFSAPAESLVA